MRLSMVVSAKTSSRPFGMRDSFPEEVGVGVEYSHHEPTAWNSSCLWTLEETSFVRSLERVYIIWGDSERVYEREKASFGLSSSSFGCDITALENNL